MDNNDTATERPDWVDSRNRLPGITDATAFWADLVYYRTDADSEDLESMTSVSVGIYNDRLERSLEFKDTQVMLCIKNDETERRLVTLGLHHADARDLANLLLMAADMVEDRPRFQLDQTEK